MKKYRLINNDDVSSYVDLSSEDEQECLYEALDKLGWSVVQVAEEEDSENQLKFNFIAD